jgi:hypothetical protein
VIEETLPETRAARFTELDAQIRAEAEACQNRPQPTPRRKPRRRRSTPSLPPPVRKEIARFARQLIRLHRQAFIADHKLKDRAARLLRSLLLPRPRRRGRPGLASVTKALALLQKYRRQHPGERPEQIWGRVYPETIRGYASLTAVEQLDARQVLRERVRWRVRDRKRRAPK